ncbi:YidC/Oxa1 family membrane protein insertase [Bradyrhizobium sp. USDA 4353]
MTDNRNTILAVILSGLVLILWQVFYNGPQMEKQRAQAQLQAELAKKQAPAQPDGTAPSATPQPNASGSGTPSAPGGATAPATGVMPRDTAIAATPRVKIDTPRLTGSISLKGARLDDLAFVQYRETVDPKSPAIVLFSPSNTAEPYYAEFGWVAAPGAKVQVPDQNTVWQQDGSNALTATTPVKLTFTNSDGLTFKRTVSVDEHYLFTIKDEVANAGSAPGHAVSVRPDLAPRHAARVRLLHPA